MYVGGDFVAVVREDIVQIAFDVLDNPVDDIVREMEEMRRTVIDATRDSERALDGLTDVSDTVREISNATDTVQVSFDDLGNTARETQSDIDNAMNNVSENMGDVGNAMQEAQSVISNATENTVDSISNIGENARQTQSVISNSLGNATESITDLGNTARETQADVGGIGEQAQQNIPRATSSIEDFVQAIDSVGQQSEISQDNIQGLISMANNMRGVRGMDAMSRALEEISQQAEVSDDDLRRLTRSAQRLGTADGSIDDFASAIQSIGNESEISQDRINSLRRIVQRLGNVDGVDEIRQDLERLSRQSSYTEDDLQNLRRMAQRLGNSTDGVDDGFQRSQRSVKQCLKHLRGCVGVAANLVAESGDFSNELETAQSSADGLKNTLMGVVGALGVGLGASELVGSVTEMQQALNKYQAATGSATKDMTLYNDMIKNVYTQGMGESLDEVATSMSLISNVTGVTNKELESMTYNGLLLRDTFGYDVEESIKSVDMLMRQFGVTSDEAYSLIAQGTQQGLNKMGDLNDMINEYSVHFNQLGFSADEMFNIIDNGSEVGVFQIEKIGDAMKEFGIRVIDGSDTTAEGFASIGLNAKRMATEFGKGGDAAKDAFLETIQALKDMENPVERNIAGVALFGTMWEDLGSEAILSMGDIKGEITTTTEALEQINEIRYDDIGSVMTVLGREIKIGLGEAILPVAKNVMELYGELEKLGTIDLGIEALKSGFESTFDFIGSLVSDNSLEIKTAWHGVKEVFSVFSSSTMPNLKRIVSNVFKTILKTFNKLQPSIKKVAKGFDGFVEVVADLSNYLSPLSGVIASVIKVFVTWKVTAALVSTGLSALNTATTTFKTVTDAAKKAQELFNLAMAANPYVAVGLAIATVVAGIWALANAIQKAKLDKLRSQINENISGMTSLKDAMANCEPQIADYNKLLSESGHTLDELDTSIDEAEQAVTDILKKSFEEQGKLRDEDIADIKEYLSEIEGLNNEKLSIYMSQQAAQLEKLKSSLQSEETLTQENMAQHITNMKEAYEQTKQAAEDSYTSQLTMIENMYKKQDVIDGVSKEQAIKNAQEHYNQQIAEATGYTTEMYGLLQQYTQDIISNDQDLWGNLNYGKEQYSFWNKGEEYLTQLAKIDSKTLETGNSFLNMSAMITESGGQIDSSTKEMITLMLSSFDGLPDKLSEDGKEVLLALASGLESQIPALQNAGNMSAQELVNAISTYFGISSSELETVGSETGRTLVESMDEAIANGRLMVSSSAAALPQSAADSINANKGVVDTAVQGLAQIPVGTGNTLLTQGNTLGGQFGTGVSQSIIAKKGDVQSAVDQVTNITATSTSMLTTGQTLGAALPQGMANGILSATPSATTSMTTASNDVINAGKTALGVHSPSTITTEMGMNLMQGMANGINNGLFLVTTSIQSVSTQIMAAMGNINFEQYNIAMQGIATKTQSVTVVIVSAFVSMRARIVGEMNGISNMMSTVFSSIQISTVSKIQAATNGIVVAIQSMRSQVASVDFSNVGSNITQSIANGISSNIPVVTSTIQSAMQQIVSEVNGIQFAQYEMAMQGIVTKTQLTMTTITTTVTNMKTMLVAEITNVVTTTNTAFASMQTTMISTTTAAATGVVSAMQSMKSQIASINLSSTGANIIQGLINGMNSKRGALLSTAQSIATSISSTINNALDVHSPSRVMLETGLNIDRGAIKGMEKGLPALKQTAQMVGDTIATHGTVSGQSEQPTYTPKYTPANSVTTNSTSRVEYNTYSPQFTLNMNGASATSDNKRQVQKWIADSLTETFKSLERKNSRLREV